MSATVQLIDAEGQFVGNLPVNPTDTDLTTYRTVAVVGCQSGGKSTLLNHVFGTQFPVLDAPRRGRRRTTLGVWSAVVPPSHPTLSPLSNTSSSARYVVLDVEGTDSRERGEGAKTFENRTTLFTLALSDCVLVNMWAHDIGRYTAANYELFDTVFAHALALRQHALQTNQDQRHRIAGPLMVGKPVTVLIVVRDHDGESAVADIKRVLMGDLRNIWDALRAGEVPLESVFDIDVVALPHKTYAADAFADGIRHLSTILTNRLFARGVNTNNNNNTATSAPSAPLGAFDALATRVWSAVSECAGRGAANNLDLPRQAALAAHFRCGEIARGIWDGEVGSAVDGLRVDVETHWTSPLPQFGERLRKVGEGALRMYDESTEGYKGMNGNAVAERRKEFGIVLAERLTECRERFLSVAWDSCMNGFDDEFRPMLGGTRGFERNARRLARTFICRYRGHVREAEIPSCVNDFIIISENDNEDVIFVEDAQRLRRRQPQQTVDLQTVDRERVGADAGTAVADGLLSSSDMGEGAEEVDVVDLQLDEVMADFDDFEEGDGHGEDTYSVERFRRQVNQKVEERKRMGEVMLPGGAAFGPAGVPKRERWWKGLLIRGIIILINYIQATQSHRATIKMQQKHEKEFPPSPSF